MNFIQIMGLVNELVRVGLITRETPCLISWLSVAIHLLRVIRTPWLITSAICGKDAEITSIMCHRSVENGLKSEENSLWVKENRPSVQLCYGDGWNTMVQ